MQAAFEDLKIKMQSERSIRASQYQGAAALNPDGSAYSASQQPVDQERLDTRVRSLTRLETFATQPPTQEEYKTRTAGLGPRPLQTQIGTSPPRLSQSRRPASIHTVTGSAEVHTRLMQRAAEVEDFDIVMAQAGPATTVKPTTTPIFGGDAGMDSDGARSGQSQSSGGKLIERKSRQSAVG